ncbi:Fur family transcriptional regulator [Lutispora sp.]|uniref:Fur family transcriptional regulator n=1 Tax=Lutispora sp. TaxID=2828727 RepID=UPI002B1E9FD4|nr:Fur family transcriptional regulator [Lutispora sp.]MEA4961667.1 Fur family transcriptional regulator [Lutispora sp.]
MLVLGYEYEMLRKKIKEKGFKFTPQRKSILDVIIANEGKHLSAEEIYEMVKNNCPDIGLATVYRTMQILDEAGMVYKHNFDDGRSRYELYHDEDHQHHHLICINCGKVVEVEEDLLEQLEHEVESKYDFSIINHNLKFFGYCRECRD